MRKSGTHVISQEEKSLDDSTICHKMFQVYPTIDGSSNEESANKQIMSICKNVLNKGRWGGGGGSFRIQEQMKRKKKALLNFSGESLRFTFEHIMTHYRQKLKVSEVFCTVYVLLLKLAKINTKENEEKNGILMSLPLPCSGWLH